MNITLSECSISDKQTAAEWEGIYNTNPTLTYFSSYEFNQLFVKKFSKEKSRRSLKPVIVRAYDSKRKTLMFLPLCKRHESYYMLWDYSSVPYCNAVFRQDIKREELDYIFDHLSEVIGNNTIYFTKMNDNSDFTNYLYDRYSPYKKRSCGSVELLRSYEYTYKLIDKECREIIEEALGRIENEGIEYRTDFYLGKRLPSKASSDISLILNGEKNGPISKLKRFIRNRNSAVISSILQGNNSLVAISYIDGYPVACLYGFVRNKTFTLLKSASTKYGVTYSAKHLIFSDLIRYSVENKVANNIDLCRTDDKFKTDFMSKKHHTYSFEIKL